ncbi:MAG TPA: response regulator [Ktedonobacterales bacterium]|nr:response regulator [Ktedonobacterales bacterium]
MAVKRNLALQSRQDGHYVRALIVDDDPEIRGTVSMILREEGYEVCEAGDGSQALQLMFDIPEPMVVLLDMRMPIMNGETALKAALEQDTVWSRVSFVIMTANPQMMSPRMREILKLHGIPLLVKPFDIDECIAIFDQSAHRLSGVPVVERARRSGSLS